MFPGFKSLWTICMSRRYSRATKTSAIICLARVLLTVPWRMRKSERLPLGQYSTSRYNLFWFLKDWKNYMIDGWSRLERMHRSIKTSFILPSLINRVISISFKPY